MTETRDVILCNMFNDAISELYCGDGISTNDIIVACTTILVAYIKDVNDLDYKLKRFNEMGAYIAEQWGLLG